jgi:polyribonucleotide nucleotidyltransferase
MLEEREFTTTVGSKELTFRTGKLAEQAGGAVSIQVGDSLLLATATMSKSIREGLDFFPLMVDFEEKLYAAGRIPGGFFRREGRPSTDAVLIARLTDRPLRPLFPDGMRNEVQVIVTALSSDSVNHLDIMTVNASSAAVHISDIPWNGPVGAVRIGMIDGEFVVDPLIQEMDRSNLDLRIAATRDAIIMVEAGANEVDENTLIEALEFGHNAIQPIIDLQEEMRAAVGKAKREIEIVRPDETLVQRIEALVGDRVRQIFLEYGEREERNDALTQLREEVIEQLTTDEEVLDGKVVNGVIQSNLKRVVRDRILHDGVRPDGRGYEEIRELSSEVGISPRAHGSGLFRRGRTQVLSIATLGTPREAQKLDNLYPEESQRFMHHYNFPPYSTGETWFLRGPKRREIGHGKLAETAVRPMIPTEEEFPYTIRVVSEVLSSNGSTSQASVCATILALMDAGVPIKRSVAGVAMGMVKEGDRYAILSDIQGMEDHLGDMDFKVAGSREGVTALQMDIKIQGISRAIMAQALQQAHQGRMHILNDMDTTMSGPREGLSKWAPRMETVKIDPDQIGAIIGKGGSTIRGMEEEFEVSIDIQEDGTVFVAGVDGEKTDLALERIRAIAKGPELGEVYLGKVVRVVDFGAFVELIPGTDGLVHISQLSTERVERVEDAVQVGDEVMVMVTDVDKNSEKVRLSRQAVLEGWTLEEARANDSAINGSRGGRGGRGGRGRR